MELPSPENKDGASTRSAEGADCAAVDHRLSALAAAVSAELAEYDVDRTSVPVRNGQWWYVMRRTPSSVATRLERLPVDDAACWQPPTDSEVADRADVVLDLDHHLDNDLDHDVPGRDAQIGTRAVSPDGRRLAWSYDRTGSEQFAVAVQDLTSGDSRHRVVATGVGPGVAWSPDSAAVHTVDLDDQWRPWRVRRHRVDSPAVESTVVLTETDPLVAVRVSLTRSGDHVLAHAVGPEATEVSILSSDDPVVLVDRNLGRRCAVDHVLRAGGRGEFLALHDGVTAGFSLALVPPPGEAGPWVELTTPHAGLRLTQVLLFAGFDVLSGAVDGHPTHLVRHLGGPTLHPLAAPPGDLPLMLGQNDDQGAPYVRFTASSYTRPPSTVDYDPLGETWHPRGPAVAATPGVDHETRWATSPDGTEVPLTVLRPQQAPAPGPVVLVVYGSYGIPLRSTFDPTRLPYLRRGVTVALAHVRGGGELGPGWHAAGRGPGKSASVADYLACARELVSSGIADPDRILATGASAGGTLVAAALNHDPTAFVGAALDAPFVDPLGSLSDPDQPFATRDREEWGDPDDPDDLAALQKLSPLQNVRALPYPPVWCTAAANDVRVPLHGPTAWVQALRAATTSTAPIHLDVLSSAGHHAVAGRTPRTALRIAWALDTLGAHAVVDTTPKEPA